MALTESTYAGRQILAVEAMRSIMLGPTPTESPTPDPHGREPFQHPALANVDKLSLRPPQEVFSVEKISKLASHLGTFQIMRWHPRVRSLSVIGLGWAGTSANIGPDGTASNRLVWMWF